MNMNIIKWAVVTVAGVGITAVCGRQLGEEIVNTFFAKAAEESSEDEIAED